VISWLKKSAHQIEIVLLMLFRPTRLFERINQLSWYKAALRQWIDDQLIKANSRVLEVGSATGVITAYLSNIGLLPTGVDANKNMIKQANRQYDHINFAVADALDLSYQDESFEAVVSSSLINIIADKQKAVSELFRVCKKGGQVSILVPFDQFSSNDFAALDASLYHLGFSAAALRAWYKNPPKMNDSEIIELLKSAGFTKVTIKPYLQGMIMSASAKKPA